MRVFMQTPPTAEGPPRFFELILQEDLLGGWSLIRQSGRTGTRGTLRKELFDDQVSAQQALVKHRDQQLRKGFVVMFIHGGGSS
jgi:predicted DNA-binding WGR domain protein